MVIMGHPVEARPQQKTEYVIVVRHYYNKSILIVVKDTVALKPDVSRYFDFHPQILQSELERVIGCEVGCTYSFGDKATYLQIEDIEVESYDKVTFEIMQYFDQLIRNHRVRISPKVTTRPSAF